ncbi:MULTISPECIES: hypothetical protein [Mycobacteriaceae]|uniref:hypothetical protein n=1 Tax=Mycobacteriaceae TaxID=1762 RepID=UPI000AD3DA32|nr:MULTISPECIES: hypothetical protein [Mycobacteriaceae]
MLTLLVIALLGGPSATPAPTLPMCQFEDGNADGQPCMWIDPDTGVGFYVASENYR